MKLVIALSFLVLSTTFVVTLIIALMKMLNLKWDKDQINGWALDKHFKAPLLTFIAFIVFIFFVIPILEAQ